MNKELIVMGMVLIVFLVLGVEILSGLNELKEKRLKSDCELSTFYAIDNILEEIQQAEDSQQFCNNVNCSDYFQDRIDGKIEFIEQLKDYSGCDKSVEEGK